MNKKRIIIISTIALIMSLLAVTGLLWAQNKAQLRNKPNIVYLAGGMGNQMFQYAFGKALEKKTGRKTLFFGDFDHTYQEINKRQYALDVFNLNIDIATKENIRKTPNSITERNPFKYDSKLFKKKFVAKYFGYFQNEKYFKKISRQIRRDFTFPVINKNDKFNQDLLNQIKKAKNPVFIHIRRDDYLYLKWELPAKYYKDAIQYIQNNVKEPTYFVFGINSSDFIKNELKLDVPYILIGDTNHINNEDWKDMMLMSKCKHGIIANSTFSWWAAWLGPNQRGGIVVAPSPFIMGQDEIVCNNWVKIKR